MKLYISLSEEKRPELSKVEPEIKRAKAFRTKLRQIPVHVQKEVNGIEDDDNITNVKEWVTKHRVSLKDGKKTIAPADVSTARNYQVFCGRLKMGAIFHSGICWRFLSIHVNDREHLRGLDKDPETKDIKL